MTYQSKLVQKLDDLYHQWDKTLAGSGIPGVIYRMFRGEVPHMLKSLDKNPETQQKIRRFVIDFAEEIREEEDNGPLPDTGGSQSVQEDH